MTVFTKNIVMMMGMHSDVLVLVTHTSLVCVKYTDFQDNLYEDGHVDNMIVLIVIVIVMNILNKVMLRV